MRARGQLYVTRSGLVLKLYLDRAGKVAEKGVGGIHRGERGSYFWVEMGLDVTCWRLLG